MNSETKNYIRAYNVRAAKDLVDTLEIFQGFSQWWRSMDRGSQNTVLNMIAREIERGREE